MQRHKFQFIGEALAFDFVNTEIVVRRKPVDLLNTADDLLEWWNAALDHYDMRVPVPPGQDIRAAFMRAKTLRSALRRLFTAVVEKKPPLEADLEILNDVLSVGHSRLVVTPENRFGVDHVSEKNDAMLLTIVHSAAWLLTECERERLHKCKNDQCVLMFLDTTKNGNRVWCSTDCMNRARSSKHYHQSKQDRE